MDVAKDLLKRMDKTIKKLDNIKQFQIQLFEELLKTYKKA